jgi:plastocyanin
MTTRDTLIAILTAALLVSGFTAVGLVPTVAQSPSAAPITSPAASIILCPSPPAWSALAASPIAATSPEAMASPAVLASPAAAASSAAAASPAVATGQGVIASPVVGARPEVVASPGAILSPATGACPTDAIVEAEIHDFEFEPAELTVGVGTAVRWTNVGPSVHTVTAKDGWFDSAALAPGATFEHTFNAPGVYGYFCVPHPNLSGTIIVH